MPPPRIWSVEVPAARQLWASELIEFVESKVSKQLRGRLQVCLSIRPGVEFQKVPGSRGRKWRIQVGFSTIAVLSSDEIKALALQRGVSTFHPITRVHVWLTDLLISAARWKSAPPPHLGFFSFTRISVEWLVEILKPFPAQLQQSILDTAGRQFPVEMILCSIKKAMKAGMTQVLFMRLYHATSLRGKMLPYTEGIYRLCRRFDVSATPAFTRIEWLWVCERQLLRRVFGLAFVHQARSVGWDDLKGDAVPYWRANANKMRPVLDGLRVADMPELVAEWRAVLKRWLLFHKRAPTVSPDRQRQFLVLMLGFVFAVTLLDAGWEVSSTLGEQTSLVKGVNSLEPFRFLRELGSGAVSAAQFREGCRNAAVADLLLAGPGEALSAS